MASNNCYISSSQQSDQDDQLLISCLVSLEEEKNDDILLEDFMEKYERLNRQQQELNARFGNQDYESDMHAQQFIYEWWNGRELELQALAYDNDRDSGLTTFSIQLPSALTSELSSLVNSDCTTPAGSLTFNEALSSSPILNKTSSSDGSSCVQLKFALSQSSVYTSTPVKSDCKTPTGSQSTFNESLSFSPNFNKTSSSDGSSCVQLKLALSQSSVYTSTPVKSDCKTPAGSQSTFNESWSSSTIYHIPSSAEELPCVRAYMEKHQIEHPKAKFDRLRMLNSTDISSQSSIFSEGTTINSSYVKNRLEQ